MHKMMHEKHRRAEQIRADQAAMDRIDETIKSNIQPCLVSQQDGMISPQPSLQLAVLDLESLHTKALFDRSLDCVACNTAVVWQHSGLTQPFITWD